MWEEKKMTDVQKLLLNMFEWFHKFCEEHQLQYYMLGGTMLGAARHQGFIPWDDDIDVGMPREDYKKFCEYVGELFDGQYIIELPKDDNPEFQYMFAKVYDTKTTLIENTRSQIKRGLYLDVFPLDGIGETMEKAKENYKPILKRIQLHCSIVCAYRKERKWYKNFSLIMGRVLSPLFIKERTLNRKIDEMSQKYSFADSNIIGNFYGAWGVREIMPKAYLGTPTLCKFENIFVYGAENPDAYLSTLYGNWRELPPVEKRKTHHDYVCCDLSKSYIS